MDMNIIQNWMIKEGSCGDSPQLPSLIYSPKPLKEHADSKHESENEDVARCDAQQAIEFFPVEGLQVF